MLQRLAIVPLIIMLSGCSIVWPRTRPPSIVEVTRPIDKPPAAYLVKCQENLPHSGVPEDVWNELTGDQQLRIILNISAQWAREYHVCGERQRALIGWANKIGEKSDGKVSD